ncbi:MAG: hypothetical protein ACKO45_01910, partial [Cyanobium sp.]
MVDSSGPPLRPLFPIPAHEADPFLAPPARPLPGPLPLAGGPAARGSRLSIAALPLGAAPLLGAPVQAAPPPPAAAGFSLLPWLTPLLLAAVLLGGYRLCCPNCRPDQILVIAGRRQRRRDGQETG